MVRSPAARLRVPFTGAARMAAPVLRPAAGRMTAKRGTEAKSGSWNRKLPVCVIVSHGNAASSELEQSQLASGQLWRAKLRDVQLRKRPVQAELVNEDLERLGDSFGVG